MCVHLSAGVCRGRKKASDLVELELQAIYEQLNGALEIHLELLLSLSAHLFYLYTAVMIYWLSHNCSIICNNTVNINYFKDEAHQIEAPSVDWFLG